jgi:hypothetical protein
MTHRRNPINIDDPVEYLTHPNQVQHALRHPPREPNNPRTDKSTAKKSKPALGLKEQDQ